MKAAPVFERFQALGCGAVVGVTDAEALSAVMAEVRAEVVACDLACSRFRDDSELMSLNDPARVNCDGGCLAVAGRGFGHRALRR